MVPSANILIGISSDPNRSRDLLSWAVNVLAHPNHHIVALHVLAGGHAKKGGEVSKSKKYQSNVRRAKAYVISLLGEFAKSCQSKEIHLEAKVGFSTSVGRGLVQEAKSLSTEFLLLGGLRGQENQYPYKILRYCLDNAPRGCAVVSITKFDRAQPYLDSKQLEESYWSTSKLMSSPVSSLIELKSKNSSPRTVLDDFLDISQSTVGDSSCFDDSTVRSSTHDFKGTEPDRKKQMSPCKFISSLLNSSLRRRNGRASKGQKYQPPLRCFSHEEILNATNNFHPDNMVGQGGYSEVYRGDLRDGKAIAVKRLAKDNTDEAKEKEFLSELGIISHVRHPNAASLVGYCIENGLYLVFEFSLNGNLASALHGKTGETLAWSVRYKIAIGVAKGLHYLHKRCKHRIIHRDIKASNILLGPNYKPQITDFGLAKWLPNKWTHHAGIPIEGTFGYLAPEYFMHGIVDEKIDVFAFGVLLLEIVTGRRPVDSSKRSLLLWAMPLMESGEIAQLADPKLEGNYDLDQLRRVVLTASYCVRQSSIWRPIMSEVLELLINGEDSEAASRSWRIPKSTSDEMDDYSMVFGYEVPTDISLEDSL
ncbi:probable receptor-like serine/threonine-protein kinase At5g57670 isoform X2 [Punica granatum]|uniref:Probable receptor-like serine/threonine-protein kinase At5g57670 isoform X2 n=1 Tax=Punica granatum TaxID=22663 RepID=A0A6P8CNS5_PUNGR|nr:probable receptor-like serine/threonine-protein kinase At5g57670 isoform X2 [Punica granatum]